MRPVLAVALIALACVAVRLAFPHPAPVPAAVHHEDDARRFRFRPLPKVPPGHRIQFFSRRPELVRGVPGMIRPMRMRAAEGGLQRFEILRRLGDEAKKGRYFLYMEFMLDGFEKRSGEGITRSVDELSVFFDIPKSLRLDLTTNGTTGQVSISGRYGGPRYVGKFPFKRLHALEVELDLDARRWSARLNDRTLFRNAPLLIPVQGLRTVRIMLKNDSTLGNEPVAYLDRVWLYELFGAGKN